jgi:uncharacterized repeat protein (TIGR02543 family)
MAENVAADGIHGVGVKLINGVGVDLSTVEVVGAFTGSQMAAVDVDAPVGLIDHVGEGEVDTPFAARTVVVEGAWAFTSSIAGALPDGMEFDNVTGVLSGTPTESGEFLFQITADDGVNPEVVKNDTLRIAAVGEALPAASLVDTAVSPPGSGTTTGDGSFPVGTDVTVNATPTVGYHFVNWTDNGKVVGTSTSHTFSIDVNHSLIANFSDLPQWDMTTSATPEIGGNTSGGGLRDDGTSVTLIAAPNAGYSFVNWTEGGIQVSTAASYTFTAAADRALVANFIVTPTYAVGVSAAPLAGGTASGGGNYPDGSSATVLAVEAPGYVFAGWKSGSTLVSSSPGYTFTVNADKALVANFVAAGIAKSVGTTASPAVGGMVSGSGTYLTGVIATVVATPVPGYIFSKWQGGGTTVSTSASYSFTVTGNRTLAAKFNEFFVVTATSAPAIGGTTEMDSLSYKTNENARAKAFPEDGWSFENWTEDGTEVSIDEDYWFTAETNRRLVANFTPYLNIVASASPAEGGSVGGDGLFIAGDTAFLTADATPGYVFQG